MDLLILRDRRVGLTFLFASHLSKLRNMHLKPQTGAISCKIFSPPVGSADRTGKRGKSDSKYVDLDFPG